MRILRNRDSATGLSRLSGEPIERVSDLPEHRVEIHAFVDAEAAAAFVAGLGIAGNPNRIAWTWEPGDSEANRTVLVARLDEPRPDGATVAECLPRIGHGRTGHDSRAHGEAMARIHAERDRAERAGAERLAPLRGALRDAGIEMHRHGNDWIAAGEATFHLRPDGIRCEFHDHDDHGDAEAIVEACREAALASGFRRTDGRGEYLGGPYASPSEACAAAAAFHALLPRFEGIRKAARHEAFMAGMKVTAARRRFLAAAIENGATLWNQRGNPQARAGGETIKASEIQQLKRAGWLREEGRSLMVTPEGAEAAGLELPAGPAPA